MHDLTRGKPVALDIGGNTWTGWTLGPYGQASDWRLISPHGEHFTSGDLSELRELQLDVDWLRLRVRELEADAAKALISSDDAAVIAAALAVLDRLSLPPGFHRFNRIEDPRADAA